MATIKIIPKLNVNHDCVIDGAVIVVGKESVTAVSDLIALSPYEDKSVKILTYKDGTEGILVKLDKRQLCSLSSVTAIWDIYYLEEGKPKWDRVIDSYTVDLDFKSNVLMMDGASAENNHSIQQIYPNGNGYTYTMSSVGIEEYRKSYTAAFNEVIIPNMDKLSAFLYRDIDVEIASKAFGSNWKVRDVKRSCIVTISKAK